MKLASEVTADKLRGGFYTPPALVDFALRRLSQIAPAADNLTLLEPSVGDGAFIRGLGASELRSRVSNVLGIETQELESAKARKALDREGVSGKILAASSVTWAADHENTARFDLAAGNPPFVRFQFVSSEDRQASQDLADSLGIKFSGVANLWIPVLLGAISRLNDSGGFSFVIPTECFTGSSARVVRSWLLKNAKDLHFDLFPPGSFPGVLQEVTVLSGRRSDGTDSEATPRITITEHYSSGDSRSWSHSASPAVNWTRYLLAPSHLEALNEVTSSEPIRTLGSLASIEVSIVTGANDFFSVDDSTLSEFGLADWARPLLPRIKHSPGLVYRTADHTAAAKQGAKTWLLDFSATHPDPFDSRTAREYLHLGEDLGLPGRYKCRIREPWFRVPHIWAGDLLLSKRSHRYPKLVVNEAGVLTTDTIYRGRVKKSPNGVTAKALSASFHNSLTMLSAEVEGRSFGGGVLELVPSEIARLAVPITDSASGWLRKLDQVSRSGDEDALISATDQLLIESGVISPELMNVLAEAHQELLARRTDRGRTETTGGIHDDETLRPAA